MVKFPPLGTNKEGVVTYTKDFFLKEKNPPKLPYLQGGKKKKKKFKSPYLDQSFFGYRLYIYRQGFQKKKSTFLSQL